MYSYQPLGQKPSKSFLSIHDIEPLSGLEVFGRLARSLSTLLPASAASCGLAVLYSPCPPYKGKIFGIFYVDLIFQCALFS